MGDSTQNPARIVGQVALVLAALLFSALPVRSQIRDGIGVPRFTRPDIVNHYRVTGSYGVNLGKISDEPGSFDFTATYQNHSIAYALSVLGSTGIGYPFTSTTEVDGLIGYSWDYEVTHSANKPDLIYFCASTGIGVENYSVRYRRHRGEFDPTIPPNQDEAGLALPLRFQAIYEPFHFAGIGVTAFATFGKLTPNYGLMASVMVGWF